MTIHKAQMQQAQAQAQAQMAAQSNLMNNYLGNMLGPTLGAGGGGGLMPGMGGILWQQAATQQDLLSLVSLQNIAPYAPVARDSSYAKQRANGYIEVGDKLLARIAFWQALGWPARWFVEKLADRLEYVTDEMSRWHEMAQEA